uniref:Glycosyltransferase family 1 protein n=1 Tax=Heterorhabditis bacteriophora TaxID=37862 RepID=A0A1I7XH44_HETBA
MNPRSKLTLTAGNVIFKKDSTSIDFVLVPNILRSFIGATRIAIFSSKCRLNSELYYEIIEDIYFPFIPNIYAGHARLMQDNAPVIGVFTPEKEWATWH